MVYGSRFLGAAPHRVLYFWHYVANRILTLLSNALTNMNLRTWRPATKSFAAKSSSPFRSKKTASASNPKSPSRSPSAAFAIYEVGISYWGRTYEEGKKIGWKDGFRALWCLVKYMLKGS